MVYRIVVGNEKGGSGKSTTAMHIATALSRAGHRVSILDLDLRQQTLHTYVSNRIAHAARAKIELPTPRILTLAPVPADADPNSPDTQDQQLLTTLEQGESDQDFIIIDCPGAHTRYSQTAHTLADTLVTPLNDSFIDLDLLGKVDESGTKIVRPSIYAEMVWSARQARAAVGGKPIDWVVLRNRVGVQNMINKQKVGAVLEALSSRIGFRMVRGFSERVIFRELFPRGLTLLDLRDVGIRQLSMSNVAARQELRDLIKALNLPGGDLRL